MVDSREDKAMVRVNQLEKKVDELAVSIDRRFDAVDRRFDAVDQRFDAVDQRFKDVEAAFVEQRQYTEFAFSRLEEKLEGKMDAGFAGVDSRLSRIERKLDQFIDAQSHTNQLVERRLTALEPRESR